MEPNKRAMPIVEASGPQSLHRLQISPCPQYSLPLVLVCTNAESSESRETVEMSFQVRRLLILPFKQMPCVPHLLESYLTAAGLM
jgi:hypothetical protein